MVLSNAILSLLLPISYIYVCIYIYPLHSACDNEAIIDVLESWFLLFLQNYKLSVFLFSLFKNFQNR